MTTVQLPVTFKSHPLVGWLGGVLSLLMMALGVRELREYWLFGASLIAMSAFGAFGAFTSLRRDRFYITVMREGFEFAGILRKQFVPWRDVEKIVFIPDDRVNDIERVGWQYTQRSGLARPESRRRAVHGYADEFLPTSYRGITPKELSVLLDAVLQESRR